MTVPFERLGAGQVGRWAYQVIGSNGPVPNPRRIRYLAEPPSASPAGLPLMPGGLPGSSAFAAYAQLASLGLQVVDLGLSAAILVQVRKQARQLQQLQTDVRGLRDDSIEIL